MSRHGLYALSIVGGAGIGAPSALCSRAPSLRIAEASSLGDRLFPEPSSLGRNAPQRFPGSSDLVGSAPQHFPGTFDLVGNAPQHFPGTFDLVGSAPQRFPGTFDLVGRLFSGSSDLVGRLFLCSGRPSPLALLITYNQ